MEKYESSDSVTAREFKRLRNNLELACEEITKLKQNDDEIKNSEAVRASIAALTAAKINGLINENNELKAKLQSVKADAVKSFGHEIGLYDSEYDDQEYIEVSRNSIRDHIEQLRKGEVK